MHRSSMALSITGIMVLLLMSACTEESGDTAVIEVKKAPVAEVATPRGENASIMDEPVDFSTQERIARTMQNIREQAGAKAARKIDATMGHMMTYDLSVGRDEAKMYKKLNGKTPNQIIAMGTARR